MKERKVNLIKIDEEEIGPGQKVSKGDTLAEIHDFGTLKKTRIKSPIDCLFIAHFNNPVVNTGDALFHLAF